MRYFVMCKATRRYPAWVEYEAPTEDRAKEAAELWTDDSRFYVSEEAAGQNPALRAAVERWRSFDDSEAEEWDRREEQQLRHQQAVEEMIHDGRLPKPPDYPVEVSEEEERLLKLAPTPPIGRKSIGFDVGDSESGGVIPVSLTVEWWPTEQRQEKAEQVG